MRILIAEDDLTYRSMLAAELVKSGHTVQETNDGLEAWEAMLSYDAPRLAIIDWLMPELDGLEVIRRVRAMQSSIPPYMIMLTVKNKKADIISGLHAGADDYLTKPFDVGELQARVEVGRRMLEIQDALAAKVEALHLALEQIKTLRGIVPICANCKKIRDDRGYWNQVEVYLREHTEANFSHGICPQCIKTYYPNSEAANFDATGTKER
jgi:phosphoserine phosphatase RsbU/P